jgi:hypothetical protein
MDNAVQSDKNPPYLLFYLHVRICHKSSDECGLEFSNNKKMWIESSSSSKQVLVAWELELMCVNN